ncbi:MAG TPA: ATP-binding protein, partial [Tepidisphaeraceae bacterium]|nr:ATP-binding protein [Tepidisphaeraceae bacterium]
HGNKLDVSKTVTVDSTISDEMFEITIHDQGAGFIRENVPDPTADENLERPSGRGVLLIESYMTTVEYSDQGRKLFMQRKSGAKK